MIRSRNENDGVDADQADVDGADVTGAHHWAAIHRQETTLGMLGMEGVVFPETVLIRCGATLSWWLGGWMPKGRQNEIDHVNGWTGSVTWSCHVCFATRTV